ncbi:MAG: WYL domain-containing protein [Bacteroidales bacterium]|nr:WYL domain-containing protein [Bacteroidales bacterium]
MKSASIFKQYVWLVDIIRRARRITLADIGERWQRTDLSEGKPLSRTTFNRHRDAVEEIFGITIACDADNRYYIVDNELFRTDAVQQWMLSTLTVSNIVGEARGLHDRILLESIPTEGETLRLVVEAMQHNVKVHLTYRTYRSNNLSDWTVEPYCIKLFRRRWYLLCRLHDRGFLVLSFDRINSLELTGDTFAIDPTFDANTFFAEYFGVMTDDRVPLQRIVLRAFGNERFALRDLPLHHSQKLVEEGDDYVDFELKLRPTTDFLAHILSRGQWVKIISPDDIAQKINDLHKEALE